MTKVIDIKSKNTIASKEVKTYGQLIQEHLDNLDDDTRNLKVYSCLMMMDTENGLGYQNMIPVGQYHLVGLIECLKVLLIDDAYRGEMG